MVGFDEEVAEVVPSVFGVEGLWIFEQMNISMYTSFLGVSMTNVEYKETTFCS